jgi:hypothetical protein
MRTLWRALRYPRLSLYAFDAREAVRRDLARGTWGWLVAIAVLGTILYGSALPRNMTLRLLGATALSWCLFGPCLVLLTRKSALSCAHACLVTMTYGIAVLAVGAGLSHLLSPAPPFHIAWVALSNAIMATALIRQLEVLEVRPWRTLLAWTVVLDGAGIALFGLLP